MTPRERFVSDLVAAIDRAVDAGLLKDDIIAELEYQVEIVCADGEIPE